MQVFALATPALLAAAGLLGLPGADAVYFYNKQPECPPFSTIVSMMRRSPMDPATQSLCCEGVQACVDTSNTESQDSAAAAGVIHAVVDALRNHPLDKEVQSRCISAIGAPLLFNRNNDLLAGRLGGLNLTLAAYARWMDDPLITRHGGDIGCFQDFCPENRAILRELGGVELLIQNIKNNFHGKYSEWNQEAVTASLFGLSSGTWNNADIAYREGFLPLSLQLMEEKTGVVKIAEETLQAIKAMFWQLPGVRREFSQHGLARTLVKVLRENPMDRGATSLACLTAANLVGPSRIGGPTTSVSFTLPDAEIAANATREGLLDQLVASAKSGTQQVDFMHGGFSIDVASNYNAKADCFEAVRNLATASPGNTQHVLSAGLPESLFSQLGGPQLDDRAKLEACLLLQGLTAGEASSTSDPSLRLRFESACSPLAPTVRAEVLEIVGRLTQGKHA